MGESESKCSFSGLDLRLMINQKAYDNQMSKCEMIEQKVQNKVQQFYLCFWKKIKLSHNGKGEAQKSSKQNLLALHFRQVRLFDSNYLIRVWLWI